MGKANIDLLAYSTPCEIGNEEGNIDNLLKSIISLVAKALVLITKQTEQSIYKITTLGVGIIESQF